MSVVNVSIVQSALPPYQMTCTACGLTWTPTPKRGKVTDSGLDAAAAAHWKACP